MSDRNPKMEYKPDGGDLVQGDSRAIPDKGTGTNVPDSYGMDIGLDATNSMGKIGGATKSDPADYA